MVFACTDSALSVSPLKQPVLCDLEVIRSIDGASQHRYEEMASGWRVAILEENDRFLVSGARARITNESSSRLKEGIVELLTASAILASTGIWDITVRSDGECDRFTAIRFK